MIFHRPGVARTPVFGQNLSMTENVRGLAANVYTLVRGGRLGGGSFLRRGCPPTTPRCPRRALASACLRLARGLVFLAWHRVGLAIGLGERAPGSLIPSRSPLLSAWPGCTQSQGVIFTAKTPSYGQQEVPA
jgi:hypothetical protein